MYDAEENAALEEVRAFAVKTHERHMRRYPTHNPAPVSDSTAALQTARIDLARSMNGQDLGDDAVDQMAARIDAIMCLKPTSFADVGSLLSLVLESEGDGLDKPVYAAITNSIAFLRSAGAVQ